MFNLFKARNTMKLSAALRQSIITVFEANLNRYSVGQYDQSPETELHFQMLEIFLLQREQLRAGLPDFAKEAGEERLSEICFHISEGVRSVKMRLMLHSTSRYLPVMLNDLGSPVGYGTANNRVKITGEMAVRYFELKDKEVQIGSQLQGLNKWFRLIVNECNTVEQVVCACPTVWPLLPAQVQIELRKQVPEKAQAGWEDNVREVDRIVALVTLLNTDPVAPARNEASQY
jgi:hypothetical protein